MNCLVIRIDFKSFFYDFSIKYSSISDYCMVQFVKPNLLGTLREFKVNFVNPITNGQYQDSTIEDIRLMHKRTHVLHKLLKSTIQVSSNRYISLISNDINHKRCFIFLSVSLVVSSVD